MLKKISLSGYILTSTFNTKSTELENKIKDAVTKANTVKSDLNDYAKKTDVANDITTIKNDYVSNASLTSRLNDLKGQYIAIINIFGMMIPVDAIVMKILLV